MKINKLFLFLGLLFLGMISCNDSSDSKTIETEPIEFKKEGELSILKPDGELIKELDIEIADNHFERQTGLMYRESLGENQGMLFIYPDEDQRSFYMKNTTIPLDILFFSSDSTAVSFKENTIPMDETSLPSGAPAQFILEINAGLVQEWNIELGDKIFFERTE